MLRLNLVSHLGLFKSRSRDSASSSWTATPVPNEKVHSLFVTTAGGKSLHTQARVAVLTYLHSPRAQQITLGSWWGRHWLNGVELNFKRKTGENEQMFGSVTSGDIAEALAAQNFKVDKRQIHIAEPIKALGDYTVTVKVFRDINATVKVRVAKENVE